MLGLVQRRIGTCNKALQAVLMAHLREADGNGDAGQHADRRVEGGDLLQADTQALTDTACSLIGDLRQENDELLATETYQAVLGPQLAAQGMRHQAQGVIAGQVAVLVVVGLEMVDIQHQQRQGGVESAQTAPFGLQLLIEVAAVVKPGQAVELLQALQLRFQLQALAFVAGNGDQVFAVMQLHQLGVDFGRLATAVAADQLALEYP